MTEDSKQQPLVLFVCQHGAAKSVLAAELLERKASELHVPIDVRAAGIDPSEAIADGLLTLFPDRADQLRGRRPRRVERGDVESASVTVTFNVESDELPAKPNRQLAWDDIPAVSEDLASARDAIDRRVGELIARLRS